MGPKGRSGLEEDGKSNIILGHHSIDHVVGAIGHLDGQLVELD